MTPPIGRVIPSRVLEEAAAWFASLGEPAADRRTRQRWQAWLDADPSHVQAWQVVERISGRFSPLRAQSESARKALEAPRNGARRRALGTLVAVLTLGAPLAAWRLPWRDWEHGLAVALATHRSARGETRALALADGGSAWIGSDSVVDVEYSSTLRRLRLLQGDLLVHTAADPAAPPRPFVVDTAHGRLRALGTRFAVRVEAAHTRVDVFEGAVELAPAAAPRAARVVVAGEHALFDARVVADHGRADFARSGLARGVLVADGLRVDALLAELGRWHAFAIGCTPEVAALRVVGTYPLQEPERILAALEASLPVRVERRRGAILIAARVAAAPLTPPRRLP